MRHTETDERHGKRGQAGDDVRHEANEHPEQPGQPNDDRPHEPAARDLHHGKRGGHGRGGGESGAEHHGRGRGHPGAERFGGRARRGEVRYVLMDTLHSGAKHGYEVVKALEERSAGQYVPSPGAVYPTLQSLLDEGLVSASQEGDRRVFQLTDAGQAELAAHAAEVDGFWARFESKSVAQASRHEVAFLEEELDSLSRTVWAGLDEAIERGDQEMIRRVRQAVMRCRDDVRAVISGAA